MHFWHLGFIAFLSLPLPGCNAPELTPNLAPTRASPHVPLPPWNATCLDYSHISLHQNLGAIDDDTITVGGTDGPFNVLDYEGRGPKVIQLSDGLLSIMLNKMSFDRLWLVYGADSDIRLTLVQGTTASMDVLLPQPAAHSFNHVDLSLSGDEIQLRGSNQSIAAFCYQ